MSDRVLRSQVARENMTAEEVEREKQLAEAKEKARYEKEEAKYERDGIRFEKQHAIIVKGMLERKRQAGERKKLAEEANKSTA
jgi:hypothetical protein